MARTGRPFLLGIALLSLAACAGDEEAPATTTTAASAAAANAAAIARGRTTLIDPYLEAIVIGPSPRFDPAHLPESWYIASGGASGGVPAKISVATKDGIAALRFEADGNGAMLGRKVRIPLLDMPYLRWGWYIEAPAAVKPTAAPTGEPGVLLRVVVGFKTGAQNGDAGGNSLKIDRALSLEWRSAEGPGGTAADGSVAMRAGTSQAGRWIIEAVDLSRLYAAAWPRDEIGQAKIAFVAVGAGPADVPDAGYIAEVVLSP